MRMQNSERIKEAELDAMIDIHKVLCTHCSYISVTNKECLYNILDSLAAMVGWRQFDITKLRRGIE